MPAITFTTGGALKKSALRHANERLVLNSIRQNPAVSRADIVRITGLSPSSVTFIVKRLKAARLVSEGKNGNAAPQVGRQPVALRLRNEARLAIGVDIALSGAQLVLAGLDDKIIARKAVSWHANSDVFLDKVHNAIRSLLEPLAPGQPLGVAVALPGSIDRNTGRVIAAENLHWMGVEAGARLRRDIALPFYFENNAKVSALGEMWASERDPQPLRHFVFVSATGGLGTGIVVNGQLLHGSFSAASEFGHVILYPDGRRCQCGNTGCWEQYASDFALCRRWAELSGNADDADCRSIVAEARAGDATAKAALADTATYIGLGFVSLVNAFNPEAIIVSDYIAEAWDMIEDRVWSVLRSRNPANFLTGLRILRSRHANDSRLAGAVALVLSTFFSSFGQGTRSNPANAVFIQAAP
jgi:predicted NBD/HSP70 family sugar kinase